jgi:hypothetical protein
MSVVVKRVSAVMTITSLAQFGIQVFFFWFEAFDVYPSIVKVNYSCERRNMPRVALDMQVSGFLYNTTTKRISEL